MAKSGSWSRAHWSQRLREAASGAQSAQRRHCSGGEGGGCSCLACQPLLARTDKADLLHGLPVGVHVVLHRCCSDTAPLIRVSKAEDCSVIQGRPVRAVAVCGAAAGDMRLSAETGQWKHAAGSTQEGGNSNMPHEGRIWLLAYQIASPDNCGCSGCMLLPRRPVAPSCLAGGRADAF